MKFKFYASAIVLLLGVAAFTVKAQRSMPYVSLSESEITMNYGTSYRVGVQSNGKMVATTDSKDKLEVTIYQNYTPGHWESVQGPNQSGGNQPGNPNDDTHSYYVEPYSSGFIVITPKSGFEPEEIRGKYYVYVGNGHTSSVVVVNIR
ncbi:hypothetical protein DMA11_21585 [Marinilabiliaceae bacterium JC017]|nr:hypothetical protein DMA11_21585 [Marinilabiliaceae bacterium JC017]